MANNNHDADKIFQACLEAIQRGDETVGSVLARYPEFEPELRPQLEAASWLIKNKQTFDPRPEFVSASRERLLAQINQGAVAPAAKAAPAASEAPVTAPRPSIWEMLLNFGRSPQALRLAMAVLLIAFVLFGSSRAVLAAQTALPGDRLYPVKITQESIQVFFTLSESGDAQLHTRFAQRRLLEIQELVLENRFEYIEDTVEAYERQVDRAILALRQVAGKDPAQAEQIASELQQVLTEQNLVLAVLSESAPDETRAHLQRALDVSQAGAVTVNEIRLTAIAQTTATPTPTPTFTLTPSDTATGLVIGAVTQSASATPSATSSATVVVSGTLTVSGTPSVIEEATSTPVPTGTAIPGTGPTATATSRPQATATNTPRPTDEEPPPATPTYTATNPAPTNTPTATQPGVTPPTNTPTATSQPAPTATSVVPSPTWTPSPTPMPPSATPTAPPPPPPTDTPVPVCAASASIDSPIGNKIEVRIRNVGDVPITLSRVTIDWPLTNEELREAEMGGRTIWTGNENTSPTTIGNWSGSPEARVIAVGTFENLRLVFKRSAESSGYSVALSFEEGCSATARR